MTRFEALAAMRTAAQTRDEQLESILDEGRAVARQPGRGVDAARPRHRDRIPRRPPPR